MLAAVGVFKPTFLEFSLITPIDFRFARDLSTVDEQSKLPQRVSRQSTAGLTVNGYAQVGESGLQ